jgi:hypothetical protein
MSKVEPSFIRWMGDDKIPEMNGLYIITKENGNYVFKAEELDPIVLNVETVKNNKTFISGISKPGLPDLAKGGRRKKSRKRKPIKNRFRKSSIRRRRR